MVGPTSGLMVAGGRTEGDGLAGWLDLRNAVARWV